MDFKIGNGLISFMIAYPEFRRTAERFNKNDPWQQLKFRYRNIFDDIVNDHITISKTEYGYFLW